MPLNINNFSRMNMEGPTPKNTSMYVNNQEHIDFFDAFGNKIFTGTDEEYENWIKDRQHQIELNIANAISTKNETNEEALVRRRKQRNNWEKSIISKFLKHNYRSKHVQQELKDLENRTNKWKQKQTLGNILRQMEEEAHRKTRRKNNLKRNIQQKTSRNAKKRWGHAIKLIRDQKLSEPWTHINWWQNGMNDWSKPKTSGCKSKRK